MSATPFTVIVESSAGFGLGVAAVFCEPLVTNVVALAQAQKVAKMMNERRMRVFMGAPHSISPKSYPLSGAGSGFYYVNEQRKHPKQHLRRSKY